MIAEEWSWGFTRMTDTSFDESSRDAWLVGASFYVADTPHNDFAICILSASLLYLIPKLWPYPWLSSGAAGSRMFICCWKEEVEYTTKFLSFVETLKRASLQTGRNKLRHLADHLSACVVKSYLYGTARRFRQASNTIERTSTHLFTFCKPLFFQKMLVRYTIALVIIPLFLSVRIIESSEFETRNPPLLRLRLSGKSTDSFYGNSIQIVKGQGAAK